MSDPTESPHYGCTPERCDQEDSLTCPAIRYPGRGGRTIESVADTLGRTPRIEVIRVIEVRFLRGAGVHPDPVREVVALFREDGTPIVELDSGMADS